jgi:uncharacterized protein YndB with AHSA1/START domain
MVTREIASVVRNVDVPCSPEDAFRIFTEQVGSWWPTRTHSGGGDKVVSVTMECRLGGRVFETLTDGSQHEWAIITGWEPPHRLTMDWNPSDEPRPYTQVEVRFEPTSGGTRVELTHTGWEHLGADAAPIRDSYYEGWAPVLEDFVTLVRGEARK